MILDLTSKCNSPYMLGFLTIVKRVLLFVQIFVPILLIIFVIISFIKLLNNPEMKDGTKKIINQFLAAIIVFFIPILFDLVMGLLGETTSFSSCWKNAPDRIVLGGSYVEEYREKKKILPNAKDYEPGSLQGNAGIAELAVRVAPIADPDSTTVYGPWNFEDGGVSSSCGGKSPLPNPWYPPSQVDSRYKDFEKVMDAVINDQRPGNKAYGSCAQAAGGIIRAVADPGFDTANPTGQLEYVKNNPDKWQFVGTVPPGQRFANVCEPGDVLITTTGWEHTMIYVSNEVARTKFPNTNGNIFEAGYDPCDHAKYPRIDYMDSAPVPFNIYRSTGKGNYKYDFVDINSILGSG